MTDASLFFYSGSKVADAMLPRASYWKAFGSKDFVLRLEWYRWNVEETLAGDNPRKPDPEQVVRLMRKLAEKIAADKGKPL